MKKYLLLSIIFCFACSSYHLTTRDNPFKRYGVSSVSVPMFYNHSSLSNISPFFTRHFTQLLFELKGLDVKKVNDNVDAYLIGVISGSNLIEDTLQANKLIEMRDVAPESSGDRNALIPAETRVSLMLTIYLIRKNEFTKGIVYSIREKQFPELIKGNKAVIFEESLPVIANFQREIFDGSDSVINLTQNRGILEKVINTQAINAANQFKNIILHAF